jgi:hypothetical protein
MPEIKSTLRSVPEFYERTSESVDSPANVPQDTAHSFRPKLLLREKLYSAVLRLRRHGYILWSEFHSLLHRIQFQSNKSGYLPIIRLRDKLPLQSLPADILKLSSSESIGQLVARFQWASLSDVFLYQEGWEAGVLSCLRMVFPEFFVCKEHKKT